MLRRITKYTKDLNWFAAAIEFVIVVLGVFIGLQAQQWSQGRAEARQEAEIQLSILDDLRRDREEFALGRESVVRTISAANYVLAAVGKEPLSVLELPVGSMPLTDMLKGD